MPFNREERRIQNSKQDKRVLLNTPPSSTSMLDGDESLAILSNKQLAHYIKQKGILWWNNFTRDGNQYVDKNLEVSKNLTVYNNFKVHQHPAFRAYKSSDQSNIAVASNVQITFDTENFDNGGDFSSNAFTAPVAGIYYFNTNVHLSNIDTAAGYYKLSIYIDSTETGVSRDDSDKIYSADTDFQAMKVSTLANLSVGDTALVKIYQSSGTQQTDIQDASKITYFEGFLLAGAIT
jgi:hypothetical protein